MTHPPFSDDDQAGLGWWTWLSPAEQTAWLRRACSPAAAWTIYKREQQREDPDPCP